ncbi:olfactory receptor 6X1-like [Malaclemys terrapin pileata]|uniref:olfactory receptor 6X1-like n=1 Tax=Malaclemys terrapin pileata TaxID=2991368 RepID=UPI0023A7A3C0|nr:olfactory receptor 6X1-like [Malaclemys terrapin pileata]
MGNGTMISEFILLGFPNLHGMQMMFFGVILFMYLSTLVGNSLIITVVWTDQKLHTPMYFFLCNLSLLEIWSTTLVVPKMLANLLSDRTTICFSCCMAQVFLHFSLGTTESVILMSMSFDRYLAICRPLHHATIMTSRVCFRLAFLGWLGGIVLIFFHSLPVWILPFCRDNRVDHFYCDLGPLLKLACADTSIIEFTGFITTVILQGSAFLFTLISYIFIISTIIQIPSSTDQKKAFSTCAAHLTVVNIFYGALIFMYMRPSTHSSFRINKVVSLLNTVLVPVLDPFIYTIRNTEFKESLSKMINRKKKSLHI